MVDHRVNQKGRFISIVMTANRRPCMRTFPTDTRELKLKIQVKIILWPVAALHFCYHRIANNNLPVLNVLIQVTRLAMI